MVFAEPDRSNPQNLISLYPENEILSKELNALPNNDQLFADAIANHGTVVLGQALSNKTQSQNISNKYGLVTQGDDPKQFIKNYLGAQNNIKSLEQVAEGIGSMSIGNNDAIVRQLPTFERIGDQLIPSLALEVTRVAVGASTYQIKSSNASSEEAFGSQTGINHVKLGPLTIPTTPEGNAWIYFAPSKDIQTVSAADVLSGVIEPEFFEGKVALVGTSASGLLDLRSTPTEKNIPGVTVIAQFIDENGNVLIITSDNAIYNNSNYNTIFENNVVINYLDHAIKSDKLNLNFTDNFVTIYDNVVYEGSQGTMTTDNIVIDLISKDITIYMNNKIKKVQVKLNK